MALDSISASNPLMSASRLRQLVVLLFLVLLAFVLALSIGTVSVDWSVVLAGLRGLPGSVDYMVVMELR